MRRRLSSLAAGQLSTLLFLMLLALLQISGSGAGGEAIAAAQAAPVELPDRRTENSQTYRNPDGSFTTSLAAGPIHFRDAVGKWQPIESELVPDETPGYALRTKANSFRAHFKQELEDEFLRFEVDQIPFALTLQGASKVKASAAGKKLSYKDASPGVELRYELAADAIKETLVLETASVPRHYRFFLTPLEDRPLDVRERRDGSVAFHVAPKLEPLFVLAPPLALDSALGAVPGPSMARHATLEVSKVGQRYALDLRVDPSWLTAPGRVFPVLLDPTIVIKETGTASYNAACPTCDRQTGLPRLSIGTDASATWRSVFTFSLSAVPPGVTVTEAKLGLYWDGFCLAIAGPQCGGTAHLLDAYRLTAPAGQTWSTVQFDSAVLSSFNLGAGAPHQWMQFGVTTTVQNWLSGAQPNHGLLVKRSTEPPNASGPMPPVLVEGSIRPRLEITYAGDGVQLDPPTTTHPDGADLSWSRYQGESPFGGYEIHRSNENHFTPTTSTLLTTISDPAVTTFRDTTASTSGYYKVVVNGSRSNEVFAVAGPNNTTRKVVQPAPALGKSGAIVRFEGQTNCANYGAGQSLTVGPQSNGVNRALLQFDLRDIPSTATITSATLSLWRPYKADRIATVAVHRLTEAWEEGAGNASCTGDGATWYESDGGIRWTTDGANFDPTADASLTLQDPLDDPGARWDSFNLTALVGEWVRGDAPNHGVVVKTTDEALASVAPLTYWADDFAVEAGLRPKLVVEYDEGITPHGPAVAVSAPAAGSVRTPGTNVTIRAEASDDRRVEQVEFFVDGASVGVDSSAPYSVNWTAACAGACSAARQVTAVASDDLGLQTTSAAVALNVSNPPSTSVTWPVPRPTLPAYRDLILGDFPLAYWRLAESSGVTAADEAAPPGSGYPGTYVGPTLGIGGVLAGNSSVRLDGVDDYVGFGDIFGFDWSAPFSIEAWVKPSTIDATERRIAAKQGTDSVGLQGWDLRISTAGLAFARIRTNPSFPNPVTTTHKVTYLPPNFVTGRWYHVVGTYDGTWMKLFVDGELGQTGSSNLLLKDTTFAFRLGRNNNSGALYAGDLDEAAVYQAALTSQEALEHYQDGPPLGGTVLLRASGSDDVAVSRVEFYADGVLVGEDTTLPYAALWNTLDPGKPGYDGTVALTSKAYDNHGQPAGSSTVNVVLENTYGTRFKAGLSSSALPLAVLYQPGGGSQEQYPLTVTVTNNSSVTWTAADTSLRYSWRSADGGTVIANGPTIPLGADLAPSASRNYTVNVEAPALPDSITRARYRLRIDPFDVGSGAGFASKGSRPIEAQVTVAKPLASTLGLERYFSYEGEPLGAGMEQLTNVATGNSVVRWTPFAAPGRGLSTVVRLTYNSLEDRSDSLVGNGFSLAVSSLTRFGRPLEVHPDALDLAAGRTAKYIVLTDGDGTRHRFEGATAGDSTVYYQEPAGVHLYLREYSTTDTQRKWALTRPDRVTFFYDTDGYPTFVEDRNGNLLTYSLQTVPAGEQVGGISKRVSAVTDAGGRAFTLEYWPAAEARTPLVAGRLKRIADHSGSGLRFDYYDDGNLLRLTQEGGQKADGSQLAERSFVFTYTTAAGDGPAIPTPADRINPNPATVGQSARLFSVRDPRLSETTFAYVTSGVDQWKLASRTNRAGKQTTFGYDNVARETTVTAPLARVTKYRYDAENKVTSVVSPLNQTTTLLWDGDRHLTKVTEPSGEFVEYAYNDNGVMTDAWDQLQNRTSFEVQNLTVDANDVAGKWEPGRTIPHLSQITKRTNPKGTATPSPTTDYQWTFSYNTSGNLTTVRDPLGYETAIAVNADGTVSSVTDQNQQTTQFAGYDANGFATQITDPLGKITRFGYDTDGLLLWAQDPLHANYSEGEPREYQTTFDYDSFHRLGRTSSPKSTATARGILIWTGNEYDPNDNVTAGRAPVYAGADGTATGSPTTSTYDPMDRLTLVSNAEGEQTGYLYDDAGRVTRVTTPKGMLTQTPDTDFAVFYAYDPLDRVIRQTRHLGAQQLHTHFCFDPLRDDPTSVTAPKANAETINCATPPGYTSRTGYDDAHRVVWQEDALAHRKMLSYDANGNVATVTDEEGDTTSNSYDERDQLVKTMEPFDKDRTPVRELTTKYEYDPVGNLKRLITPRAWDASTDKITFTQYVTTYDYDALNRLVKETLPTSSAHPEQHYAHRSYDANGNLAWFTLPVTQALPASVPADQKTDLQYFDTGWIRSSKDPANPRVHFDFTPEGWQQARTPETAAGALDSAQRMLWSYCPDGLVREVKDEGGQGTTYVYDANGNLTSAAEGTGVIAAAETSLSITATYDDLDRLLKTRQKKAGEANWRFTSYVYDSNNNVLEREDDGVETTPVTPGRSHEFVYDQADWLTSQTDYGPTSDLNDNQRITTTFTPSGVEAERVVAFGNSGGGWDTKETTTWTYFANGKLKTLQTRNGASEVLQSHTVYYEDASGLYVNGNRTQDVYTLKGPVPSAPCQGTACTATYEYDPRERLTREDDGHGTVTTFALDPAGNVTTETQMASGQTTTRTMTYAGTQLQTVTKGTEVQRYFYDSEGSVDCITTGSGTQADCSPAEGAAPSANLLSDYSYDYLNRLASFRSFQAGVEQDEATYRHDALDRPVEERERHGASGSPETTLLSYVGLTGQVGTEERRNSSGGLLGTKSYGHDAFGHRISFMNAPVGQGSESFTYGYDVHGSVSLLIEQSGQVRASYGYRAYGGTDLALTNGDASTSNPLNAYRYSGRRFDSGSGSYDMGARRFLPDVGRFLQFDLLHGGLTNLRLGLLSTTQNRYALAGGNPIGFIEIDGHVTQYDGGGGAADEPGYPAPTTPTTNQPSLGAGEICLSTCLEWETPAESSTTGGAATGTAVDLAADVQSEGLLDEPSGDLDSTGSDIWPRPCQSIPECGVAGPPVGTPPSGSRPASGATTATGARAAAAALAQSGKVLRYREARAATAGLKGDYQAHHLVEARHLRLWGRDVQNAPAVVMERAVHQSWTNRLRQALPYGTPHSKEKVWKVLQEAYASYPEWLQAVRPYFRA